MLIDKIIRKVFQQYWRLSRGLELGVKAVVLDRDDRVLLVRRANGGLWALPTACVRRGETAEDALERMLDRDFSILHETPPAFIALQAFPAARPDGHWAILAVRSLQQNDPRSPQGKPDFEVGWFAAQGPAAYVDPDEAAFIAASLARGVGRLAKK